MKKNPSRLITIVLIVLFFSLNTSVQDIEYQLDKREKALTIDSINSILKSNYIFPEVADKMSVLIETKLKKGEYGSIDDPSQFAEQLTMDLQSVSHDKHLRVDYNPRVIAEQTQELTDEERERREKVRIENMKRDNFGFREVKILDDNMGYLDLRSFMETRFAGETAVAAMNFLSNVDVLIIDLRNNGGGSPSMIQLISSYLFDEDVHLNSFYWRPTDQNTQTWTLPYVPGNRNPDVEVYVLTSSRTFSAAEEFCYNLKNLERATLVGETTGGGAHPGGVIFATSKFMVWVPKGRAINPITHTNWEGTGVIPNIQVAEQDALVTAQMMAYENLIEQEVDSTRIRILKWNKDRLEALSKPLILDESTMKSYVGKFGPRVISYENQKLYYQRNGGRRYPLISIGQDQFLLDGAHDLRLKFLKEGGDVVAVEGIYAYGNSDKYVKE